MPASDVVAVSHIGLCVSDLDKSLRFYTEGLGFEAAEGWDIPSALAPLAEVPPPISVRTRMLVKGPVKIELLGWTSPPAEGSPARTRRQVGFTHLSLLVSDIAAAEARLVALGATVIEDTRMRVPVPGGAMHVLFVADPDGVRIEMSQHTSKAREGD